MGPLIPLFWTSGDVSPGFQSQGALSPATNEFLRFTSGATPADCIEVSMAAEPFRSTYLVEVRGIKYSYIVMLRTVILIAFTCSRHLLALRCVFFVM